MLTKTFQDVIHDYYVHNPPGDLDGQDAIHIHDMQILIDEDEQVFKEIR